MAKTDCNWGMTKQCLKIMKLLAKMKMTDEQKSALLRGLILFNKTNMTIENAMDKSAFTELWHGA